MLAAHSPTPLVDRFTKLIAGAVWLHTVYGSVELHLKHNSSLLGAKGVVEIIHHDCELILLVSTCRWERVCFLI